MALKSKKREVTTIHPTPASLYAFERVRQATPRQYILIIVDPFASNQLDAYGDDLKSLCMESLGVHGDIYRFCFHPRGLFRGASSAVQTLSDKLVQELKEISPWAESEVELSNDQSNDRQMLLQSNVPLVFLVHSIAAWVVKSALSQKEYPGHLVGTQAIFQIDVPLSTDDKNYRTAARQWSTLHKKSKKNSSDPSTRDLFKLSKTTRWGPFGGEDKFKQSLENIELAFSELRNLSSTRAERSQWKRPELIEVVTEQLWYQGEPIDLMKQRKDQIRDTIKEIVADAINTLELSTSTSGSVAKTNQKPEHHPESLDPITGSLKHSPPGEPSFSTPKQHLESGLDAQATTPSTSQAKAHFSNGTTTGAKIGTLIDYGNSFLNNGEFLMANEAFQNCRKLLGDAQSSIKSRCVIYVRIQLALIKMSLASYEDARGEFEQIRVDHKCSSFPEEDFDVNHGLAICSLYLGRHKDAETRFRELLELATSDQSTNTNLVDIRRDLGFAIASQGRYVEAQKHIEDAQKQIEGVATPMTTSNDMLDNRDADVSLMALSGDRSLKGMRYATSQDMHMLNLTRAQIEYAWGNFERALEFIEEAYEGFKSHLGTRHQTTLECASFHALLLAYNYRVTEGRSACYLALETMRSELEPSHPYIIEALGHLAQIYHMQFRLTSSTYTGQVHVKTAKEVLGTKNPQSLKSRYLLAEILLACGDYASAVKELKETTEESRSLYTNTHPETLRYQSTLALAMYHSGKLDQAYRLAMEVLQKVELYTYNTKVNPISRRDFFSPRELIASQCALAEWENPELHPGHILGRGYKSWSERNRVDLLKGLSLRERSQIVVQELSQEILTTHEHQLGRCHPETVKSLIWLFTLKSCLGVDETVLISLLDDGLKRLRQVSARNERLAESLQLEHKFVIVIIHLRLAATMPNFARKALEILRGINDTIAQLPKIDGSLTPSKDDLADLEDLVKSDIKRVLDIVKSVQRCRSHDRDKSLLRSGVIS
ncbi:uncharacterized protein PG998_012123 [Apiospora kogelbergensis]|uniref:uncharacterized protein n=1 Tax=Apiospora kogelbergensis TaxID=1337665 RepID=UPI00312DB461